MPAMNSEREQEHDQLGPDRQPQGPGVDGEHQVEAALGDAVEPPRPSAAGGPRARPAEEQGAEHRRERDRDEPGDDDRHRDGDRELAQQPADDALAGTAPG